LSTWLTVTGWLYPTEEQAVFMRERHRAVSVEPVEQFGCP
jgi:hypothetical protein